MEKLSTFLLKRLMALVLLFCYSSNLLADEKEMYCAWSDDGETLIYYYDNLRETRESSFDMGEFFWDEYGEGDIHITKIVFDESFADARPTSTSGWFRNMWDLKSIENIEYLNTSNVSDMSEMFMGCLTLEFVDVSYFDTSNVTDMNSMFWCCSSLKKLDVSHFNTSNVTDMGGMFNECFELTHLDVSHFNTSKVTRMPSMFNYCESLTSLDISHFDTGNVTTMGCMFLGCSGLLSLDVSNFDTSNVIDMNYMFGGCSKLTNIDLSNFNTSNVTDMEGMFYNCAFINLDLTSFNTERVTNMRYMFGECPNLAILNIRTFNTENVETMANMFYSCGNLKSIYVGDGWNMSNVAESESMFTDCFSLVGEGESRYFKGDDDGENANYGEWGYLKYKDSNNKSMYFAYRDGYLPTELTFYYDEERDSKELHTHGVGLLVSPFEFHGKIIFDKSFAEALPKSTHGWFQLLDIQSIENFQYLNTSNVTDMSDMFYATSLPQIIDFSHFDTSNVINMNNMFTDCIFRSESIDISSFNTANVEDMTGMFTQCGLTSIYVGNGWDVSNVSKSDAMFFGCTNLVGQDGTTYDENYTDKTKAHYEAGGYLRYKENTTIGISNNLDTLRPNDQPVFNLNGQRVNNVQHGIYIKNRKKYYYK